MLLSSRSPSRYSTLRLEPCLKLCGNCLLPPTGFDPAQAPAVPGNFPGEFFYAHATTEPIPVPEECTAGSASPPSLTVELALEGAFTPPGTVAPGQQTVFTWTRIRGSGLCPDGVYTVVTPYGPREVTATAAGAINATDDVSVDLVGPLVGPTGQLIFTPDASESLAGTLTIGNGNTAGGPTSVSVS